MIPKPAWEMAKNMARSHQVGRQKHRAKYLHQLDQHDHSTESTNEGSLLSDDGNKTQLVQTLERAAATDTLQDLLSEGGKLALSTLMAGKRHHVVALALAADCRTLYKDIGPAFNDAHSPSLHLDGRKPVPDCMGNTHIGLLTRRRSPGRLQPQRACRWTAYPLQSSGNWSWRRSLHVHAHAL